MHMIRSASANDYVMTEDLTRAGLFTRTDECIHLRSWTGLMENMEPVKLMHVL